MSRNTSRLNSNTLAKLEERDRRAGRSVDPAMDIVKDAWEMGQQQRAWNEKKNMQRQRIMSDLARGTSMTFSDDELKRKKERFQNYFNKYKGSMDESTLEMGQYMLDDFDIQGEASAGDNFLSVSRFIPDFKTIQGTADVTVNIKDFPTSSDTASETTPFSITSSTTKIDTRARGRYVNVKIANANANEAWRYGTFMLDVKPDGARGG